MATRNLATIFGPLLLRSSAEDIATLVSDSVTVSNIISFLIDEGEKLFQPPPPEYEGICIANYNYISGSENELSLKQHDIILLIKKDESGWWEGECRGRRGYFPENFIEVISSIEPCNIQVTVTSPRPAPAIVTPPSQDINNTLTPIPKSTFISSVPSDTSHTPKATIGNRKPTEKGINSIEENDVKEISLKKSLTDTGLNKSLSAAQNVQIEELKSRLKLEEEARIQLAELVKTMQQTLTSLQGEIIELRNANKELRNELLDVINKKS